MWKAISYVSSAITLLAFLAAVAARMFSRHSRREYSLIRTANEEDRAELIKRTLEFFDVNTDQLSRDQKHDLAVRQISERAARDRRGTRVIIFIFLVASCWTGFAIWRASLANDGMYLVRVLVFGPDRHSVDESKVTSSVGGETKPIAGGWQIDISSSVLPESKTVKFLASNESAFLRAEREIQLGADHNPVVEIPLEHDTSARVRGTVVDPRGSPIEGARVSVVGYSEYCDTGPRGAFDLPAHAATGQDIQLLGSEFLTALLAGAVSAQTPSRFRLDSSDAAFWAGVGIGTGLTASNPEHVFQLVPAAMLHRGFTSSSSSNGNVL
ncbi:MAG TPA: carboxypeptidase-like regulatory domain-containing protein [Pyrinomonadaceae bacterium]|nr:carboxypeptidase-like regulatory domain-containing protein [Pyrinomonadaceae bacterium]